MNGDEPAQDPDRPPAGAAGDAGAAVAAARQHHRAGRLAEAEAGYERILRAHPDHADALHLLGVLAHQTGRHQRAAGLIGRAIEHEPDNARFLNNLGSAYMALGRTDEAAGCYHRAVEADPGSADGHFNLANALRGQGRADQAIACYRRALDIESDAADVHHNLGVTLADQGDWDGAAACYRRAIEIDPSLAEGHTGLGNAYKRQGKAHEAAACYRRALAIDPNAADAYNGFGAVLKDQGRLDAAIAAYRRAIEIKPDYASAHLNYSLLLLLLGEFKDGWVEYEWRWKRTERKYRARDFAQPLWDGSRLDGRTILLHAEDGLGDAIQFIRYVPYVAEYGARIVVECHPMLIRLFKDVPAIDEPIKRESPLPPFDVHAPLMTLPMIFGTTVETIPADVAYLRAESGLVEKWRDRLSGFHGRKVGLCWQGNPKFPGDSWRSIPLRHFGVLLDDPSITFINLHKGVGELQIQECGFEDRIVNYSSEVESLADTAAIMENLDLIITSDTAVAHLAGALGRPTWVLLHFVPDWRWLMDRDDMPWYPTMRLFRQRKLNDWEGVLMRVMRALEEYAAVE